jgi:predicted RNA-binding Zn-ribbon protein involved in translation (DUF1610 family)
MAEVEVTVIPVVIEGRPWIEPFPCPSCGHELIIDKFRRKEPTEASAAAGATLYEVWAVPTA